MCLRSLRYASAVIKCVLSRRVRTVFALARAASDTRKLYPSDKNAICGGHAGPFAGPARRREKRSIDVVAVQLERALVN